MATENKNLSQYDKKIIPNAESLRFGIITSQWNEQITYAMVPSKPLKIVVLLMTIYSYGKYQGALN